MRAPAALACALPLVLACAAGGEEAVSPGGAGGSHAGGMGAGGPATGGFGGDCVEIRVNPPEMSMGLNEWARPDEGLIKFVGGSESGAVVSVELRAFGPTGKPTIDLSIPVPPMSRASANCAWRSQWYLCASDDFATLGDSAGGQAPVGISILPEEDNFVAVHWDGEAFAVHATSQDPQAGALQLVRVDTSGKVIQPRTHVGDRVFGSFTPERPRIVTDPKSGRTFVVGGSSQAALVASAHERDGTPLFAMGSVLSTKPNIVSQYPAVGVYGDGALIVTQGDRTASVMWPKPNFCRLSAAGELAVLPKIPLGDGEVIDSNIQSAVVAHGPNDGWVVLSTVDAKSGSRLVLLDWKDGAFGPIQVIMDARDVVPAKKDYFLRLDDPIAFELDGQRWVGVKDLTVPGKPAVRLLRVDDPSCRYAPISP